MAATAAFPNGHKHHVLVVDDERCIAETLAAILRNASYEVAVAYSADSALRQCDAMPPDLVISDVVMPGMNGIELAIRIRQWFPDCKILLFSGMAGSADLLEEAHQHGHHFELLSKPVHPADLLANLQSALLPRPATADRVGRIQLHRCNASPTDAWLSRRGDSDGSSRSDTEQDYPG